MAALLSSDLVPDFPEFVDHSSSLVLPLEDIEEINRIANSLRKLELAANTSVPSFEVPVQVMAVIDSSNFEDLGTNPSASSIVINPLLYKEQG
jgi:hypothetical protein